MQPLVWWPKHPKKAVTAAWRANAQMTPQDEVANGWRQESLRNLAQAQTMLYYKLRQLVSQCRSIMPKACWFHRFTDALVAWTEAERPINGLVFAGKMKDMIHAMKCHQPWLAPQHWAMKQGGTKQQYLYRIYSISLSLSLSIFLSFIVWSSHLDSAWCTRPSHPALLTSLNLVIVCHSFKIV